MKLPTTYALLIKRVSIESYNFTLYFIFIVIPLFTLREKQLLFSKYRK